MSSTVPDTPDLQAAVERYPWYHTLELGDGVVTKGMFDHRPVLDRYPIPDDLSGLRCLDVATMDGYWAFEMERRGAASATALDLENPEDLDWPASLRGDHDKSMDETKAERFALAREALGSKVERVLLSAYDLSPELAPHWQRSTYGFIARRRGPMYARAVALLNLIGAIWRWARLVVRSVAAPRRHTEARRAHGRWILVHLQALGPRAELEGLR